MSLDIEDAVDGASALAGVGGNTATVFFDVDLIREALTRVVAAGDDLPKLAEEAEKVCKLVDAGIDSRMAGSVGEFLRIMTLARQLAMVAANCGSKMPDEIHEQFTRLPRRVRKFAWAVVWDFVKPLMLAIIIALGIRHFVVEAFKIPSGSMKPTLLVGDHLFVNKIKFGVRIPFTREHLLTFSGPERGDVIVFNPPHVNVAYIKRVIGLPGDEIEVRWNKLYVNGELITTVPDGQFEEIEMEAGAVHANSSPSRRIDEFEEDLFGVKHAILHFPRPRMTPCKHCGPLTVPEGHYFMMGDNRDNSQDSRFWPDPFVPLANIEGEAMFIYYSNAGGFNLRWNRFFQGIN